MDHSSKAGSSHGHGRESQNQNSDTGHGSPSDEADTPLVAAYELIQIPGEMGENGRAYFMQTSSQVDDTETVPFRYVFDSTTGKLGILQDHGDDNVESVGQVPTTEHVTLLRMVSNDNDNEEYVLQSDGSGGSESATFHYAGSDLGEMNEDDEAEERNQLSELRVSRVTSIAGNQTQTAVRKPLSKGEKTLKLCAWSRRKIADLIQCIHNHEQKFRKGIKTKTAIWNDIADDMAEIGHRDCNRDECSKKWSNLYRTWKKVKLRPRDSRNKWGYYEVVSTLARSLSARYREKKNSKKAKPSTTDLILKLMEVTQTHQKSLQKTEEIFQEKMKQLDLERDEILGDINSVLSQNRNHNREKKANEGMRNDILEPVSSIHQENLALITIQDSSNMLKPNSKTEKVSPVYLFRIPSDFGPDNHQYELVEIETTSKDIDANVNATSNPVEFRVPQEPQTNESIDSTVKGHTFDILKVERS